LTGENFTNEENNRNLLKPDSVISSKSQNAITLPNCKVSNIDQRIFGEDMKDTISLEERIILSKEIHKCDFRRSIPIFERKDSKHRTYSMTSKTFPISSRKDHFPDTQLSKQCQLQETGELAQRQEDQRQLSFSSCKQKEQLEQLVKEQLSEQLSQKSGPTILSDVVLGQVTEIPTSSVLVKPKMSVSMNAAVKRNTSDASLWKMSKISTHNLSKRQTVISFGNREQQIVGLDRENDRANYLFFQTSESRKEIEKKGEKCFITSSNRNSSVTLEDELRQVFYLVSELRKLSCYDRQYPYFFLLIVSLYRFLQILFYLDFSRNFLTKNTVPRH
jgi:hypothetical protein